MSNPLTLRQRFGNRFPAPHRLQIEPTRIPQAAVTLLLREADGDDQFLIIRRAEREGDPWSGHLALPGGRADLEDEDLLSTAARETREEVGIDMCTGAAWRELFIGQLPVLKPVSPGVPPIEITPFIAIAPLGLKPALSDEVQETWWLSIRELRRTGRSSEQRLNLSSPRGNFVRKWPAYPSPGGPIWGITERILTDFLTRLD